MGVLSLDCNRGLACRAFGRHRQPIAKIAEIAKKRRKLLKEPFETHGERGKQRREISKTRSFYLRHPCSSRGQIFIFGNFGDSGNSSPPITRSQIS